MIPYKLSLYAALIAIGFGSGWKVQEWRNAEKEVDRGKQELAHIQHSAAASIRRADNVIQAQNEAQTRLVRLRADADNARAGIARLQSQSADSLRIAKGDLKACTTTATTFSELFNQCGQRYTDLAEKAQGHVSDITTLNDAWPKE